MNPTVSRCMIVQDDAELLPRFFAAATGLWDELIVVDTGSTDATVAISGAAGARVLAHPWSDSLSDARNVGVDAATGDWILFLDANEIAPPEMPPALRAVVAEDRIGAATLRLRDDLSESANRSGFLRWSEPFGEIDAYRGCVLNDVIFRHRGRSFVLTREKVAVRTAPRSTTTELEEGVPLFPDRLMAVPKAQDVRGTASDPEIGRPATYRGASRLTIEFTVDQLVPDYISGDEFRISDWSPRTRERFRTQRPSAPRALAVQSRRGGIRCRRDRAIEHHS